MRQTTSTTSTMTRTPTRASCTTCEHALRARSLRLSFDVCVTCTSWFKVFLSLISSTFIVINERFSLSSFSTLYFDLSFTILFHFFLLTHLEQHTELDNSASCSTKHTENMPITAIQKACQSVSRHCLLCSIEQGNLWEKEMSISQLVLVSREKRTVLTASFLKTPKLRKVVDRTGKPVGENSSNALIRTLLDEQRQMIIAEYCEKIGHHELQAAHAEEERRILREELWRQQMDFREVHQQSLTEMEELRKFQSSTFDTIARRNLIEDQNTILESGRVQELQNEVNCMNDSQDFQDAESVRSRNSHVTSQPMSFPAHPIPEGLLRPSFVSPRRKEGPPCIWDTHGKSGNVFCKSTCIFISSLSSRIEPMGYNH